VVKEKDRRTTLSTVEGLLVRIDASTETLRREFKRADRKVAQSAGKIAHSLNRIAKRFSRLATSTMTNLSAFEASLLGLGAVGLVWALKWLSDMGLSSRARRSQLP
jgi:hypothetical protein